MSTYLYWLLYHVVDDEREENEFTRHDEIVLDRHISYELYSPKRPCGQRSARCWELHK